ncbi:C69 family dipeptidase [Legionella fallonii]|nr:C69 family dipeptidase [Legionella fallonii]
MPNLHRIIACVLMMNGLPVDACTTLIIGKKASLEGKTIIARTSDTIDARRAKNLKIYYDHEGKKSYLGLPYWDLEADEKNDMAQVATNANGLSISATETIQSNSEVLELDPPVYSKNGIEERNIPGIIMPIATTARGAVDILGKAIEERGLASNVGFGVLFADKDEAWYLETLSGHQWVAIKVPEDVYFVAANGPGQIQAYSPVDYEYKFSHFNGKTPIQFAIDRGIAKITETKQFNFRETFADVANPINPRKNFARLAYVQHHFNPSTQSFDLDTINKGKFLTFLKPEKKISVVDVQRIFASHFEEYSDFDPYQRYNKNENERPYYRPIASLNTSNAHVTIVDNPLSNGDNSLANLEYIALGMPTVSFYIPIYYGITQIPKPLTEGTNQADIQNEKLFWQFRRLQSLVFLNDPEKNIPFNPQERMKLIQGSYQALATEIEQERLEMEANYKETNDPTLIDNFTEATVAKVSVLNNQLIQKLMEQLHISTKYSLQDEQAMADWFTTKVREQDCNYKPEHC